MGVPQKTTETLRLRLRVVSSIHLIHYKAMTYNIFDRTAPAMPKPAKGTEIVK